MVLLDSVHWVAFRIYPVDTLWIFDVYIALIVGKSEIELGYSFLHSQHIVA